MQPLEVMPKMDVLEPIGHNKREDIVEAAALLFRQHGYGSTSIRQIASQASIRSASLYHHFSSKRDIFLAVSSKGIRLVSEDVRNAVASLPEDATPRDLLRVAVGAHLQTALEAGNCTFVNIRCSNQIPPELMIQVEAERKPYERYWREIISRCGLETKMDRSMVSLFLFGMMNWALDWFERGHWSIDEIAEKITVMSFDGACMD